MTELITLLVLLLTSKLFSAEWNPAICDCNELNSQDDFICVCTDLALNKSYVYPLSEVSSNNFSAPVRLFLGLFHKQRGLGDVVDCGMSPAFKLDTITKPHNVLRPEFIAFNNFDFDDNRTHQIGPWLTSVRSSVRGLQIMCGSMKTLHSGMFQGFSNLYDLGIIQTGLQDIELRAFAELSEGTTSTVAELYIIGNPLQSFDWSVLEPITQSLESVTLRFNNISQMQVSFPVSFPALTEINLDSNKLQSISADVMALWPERVLLIILVGNPMCPMDSLCRCYPLLPLLQFAKRTDTLIEIDCGGPTETQLYCEVPHVRRSPQCASPCIKFGNLTDIAQLSDYDYCPDFGVGSMSCEVG